MMPLSLPVGTATPSSSFANVFYVASSSSSSNSKDVRPSDSNGRKKSIEMRPDWRQRSKPISPGSVYPAKDHCSRCGLCDTYYISHVNDACAFLGDGMSSIDSLEPLVHGRGRKQDSLDEMYLGVYDQLLYARKIQPVPDAQWTGIVTTIAIEMLKSGKVEAVVCVQSDPNDRFAPRPVLARTPDEVLAAKGVKPTLSPNLNTLALVEAAGVKRLLFCGVGCQVQALRSVEKYLNLEELYVLGTNCVDNGTREGLAKFLRAASSEPETVLHYEFMQDYKSARKILWRNIIEEGRDQKQPWIITGDLNCPLNVNDREGETSVSDYEIADFKACCMLAQLTDIPHSGCFFTFSRNRMKSKIDRVLMNNVGFAADFQAMVQFLPPGTVSDHASSIIKIGDHPSNCKSFKFFNMWTDHVEFQHVVAANWSFQGYERAQFIFGKKLKALKAPPKQLNKLHFAHIITKSEEAEKKLKRAQEQALQSNSSSDLNLPELRKKAMFLNKAAMSFLSQKGKNKFLLNADKPSRFFHDLIKANQRKIFTAQILKNDGSWTDSQQQLEKEFISFFEDLIGSPSGFSDFDASVMDFGRKINADQ